MRNAFKLYGKWLIAATVFLVVSIGFLLVGIFSGNNSSPGKNPIYAVSPDISEDYIAFSQNYAQVGVELTATVINVNTDSDYTYQWYVNNELVSGATSSTYTPKTGDLEKFISVVAKTKGNTITATIYCSKLPVVYINTDTQIGDVYVTGKMAMSGNEEYHYGNTDFYYGDIQIKLRGNSTKDRDKHPYKITLGAKCDLFGMGASKHWVLLANDIDHTLIRNKLIYDFSGAIGMDYMESRNVVLILNNSYVGVYQLCEQVRIADTRVDIFDWENLADEAASLITEGRKQSEGLTDVGAATFEENLSIALKTDLSWISAPYTFTFSDREYKITDYVEIPSVTGGFLLEMDFYNFTNISSLLTYYDQPLYFNSPDPEVAITNTELMEYARKYIQSFEFALHSYDFTFSNSTQYYDGAGSYFDWASGWVGTTTPIEYDDPANDGKHYSQLFDIESLVNNFWVCEFSMNWDCMKNSTFISKDVNELAKISPVWDFDWAFGNNNMFSIDTNFPESWHTTNEWFTNEQYYQSVQWNRFLIKDPYFLLLAYNKYKEIRPTVIEDIIKKGGKIDSYKLQLKEAAAANDNKWSYSYSAYNGEKFSSAMKSLESFINTRIDWMDIQCKTFDSFVKSLGYYVADSSISIGKIDADGNVSVSVTGNDIKKLYIQVNGAAHSAVVNVSNGKATFTIPSNVLKAAGSNVINVLGLDASGSFLTKGAHAQNADDFSPVQNYKVF